jgi:hypothetical protein
MPTFVEKKTIDYGDLGCIQKDYLLKERLFVDPSKLENEEKDYYIERLNKSNKTQKLIMDLHDKKNYVVYSRLLEDHVSRGAIVTKIHRIISFREEAWLKPYIDFNTAQRKKATTDFEKNIWKLMNNAFYGKTCENIRKRTNVDMINDRNKAIRFHSDPNYKREIRLNKNLTIIQRKITSIKYEKPIFLGMVILDLSKLLMYQTFYDVLQKIWGGSTTTTTDIEIIGFDTDSFFLNIKTEDVYKDMEKIKEHLDLSNYPEQHPLYDLINEKVIGKLKDEMMGEIITEIVFLRAKQYSFTVQESERLKELIKKKKIALTETFEMRKCKGISKATNKHDLKHKNYVDALDFNSEPLYLKNYCLNSKRHEIYLKEVFKKALSSYDDKRYIFRDGVSTAPFGL